MKAPGSSLRCVNGRAVIGNTGSVELSDEQIGGLVEHHETQEALALFDGNHIEAARQRFWLNDLNRFEREREAWEAQRRRRMASDYGGRAA